VVDVVVVVVEVVEVLADNGAGVAAHCDPTAEFDNVHPGAPGLDCQVYNVVFVVWAVICVVASTSIVMVICVVLVANAPKMP
jgi:hypothetical protein